MVTDDKYFFIINPYAGKQKATKSWIKIETMLKAENLIYSFYFTLRRGDAQNIVKKRIEEGYKNFIVIGGDGTLNEVINGIFLQKTVNTEEITLGLISLGTCNDWARYYGIKNDFSAAIQRLLLKKTLKQDIGKVNYLADGEKKELYFLNVAGLGLDSSIVESTNIMHQLGKRTKIAYFLSLLKCFISFKPKLMRITVADEIFEGKFLSFGIGNGKYSGGGMCQTPDALINDGYFDISIYPNMSKIKMILNIKKLYNNKIKSLKGILCFREKTISVNYEKESLLECDGELFYGNNFNFSIIPLAINILV